MRKQVGVLLVVLAGCSGSGDGNDAVRDSEGRPVVNPDMDADGGAVLACRGIRNVASDYRDGQLTFGELRSALQDVEDDASVSEEPGIAASARAMVAAVTARNDQDLGAAISDMDRACTAIGN